MSLRAWAPVVLLALLLLAAFPIAQGEHVYSHRFVLEGRVLGADGYPVPGRTVEFNATRGDFDEACHTEPDRSVTDEYGDFSFCFHVHELQSSTRVRAIVGNVSVEKPMDTAFRRTHVIVRLADENGTKPAEWDATHRIAGKVWRSGPQTLENVFVYGLALADVPVNVTLRLPEGNATRETLMTDGYGDYQATFRLVDGVDASRVRVTVESMGVTQVRSLDPTTHVVTVGILLPREIVSPGVASFPADASPQPGARSPALPPALVGLGVAAGILMVVLKRRQGA